MGQDEYMLFADFQSYIDCQAEVEKAYRDEERWSRMSILNTARMGKFSSDRAIKEYSRDIWKTKPVKVDMSGHVQWSLRERDVTGVPSSKHPEANHAEIIKLERPEDAAAPTADP